MRSMLVNPTQKEGARTCFVLLYPEHRKLPETTEMAFLERQREPTDLQANMCVLGDVVNLSTIPL